MPSQALFKRWSAFFFAYQGISCHRVRRVISRGWRWWRSWLRDCTHARTGGAAEHICKTHAPWHCVSGWAWLRRGARTQCVPPPHQESPPFVDTLSTLGPPSDPAPLASHRPVRASGGQRPTCCRGWAPRKSTVLGLPAVRAGPVPGPDNDCLQKPWLLLPGLARNIRAFPFTLPAHWPEECRRPARGSQWAPGSRTEWESGAGQKACW